MADERDLELANLRAENERLTNLLSEIGSGIARSRDRIGRALAKGGAPIARSSVDASEAEQALTRIADLATFALKDEGRSAQALARAVLEVVRSFDEAKK